MKLIMTILVRNEEDIIRENIDFHLSQGVDFIIATDNRSVDSTRQILKSYEDKGVLHYIGEHEDTHDQGKWVTKMSRLAYSKYGADWVINNDADEFWWPSKHQNLKEAFDSLEKKSNVVEASRNNFVCLENIDVKDPFYSHMYYKETKSLNSLGKPLPPKQAHRGSDEIVVSDGNHKVYGFEKIKVIHDLIEIFHFPIRTKNQLINKITFGGAALEKNVSISKDIGNTWRNLYSQLQRDGNLDGFFNNNLYSDDRIEFEMEKKMIIEDLRLKRYLTGLKYDC